MHHDVGEGEAHGGDHPHDLPVAEQIAVTVQEECSVDDALRNDGKNGIEEEDGRPGARAISGEGEEVLGLHEPGEAGEKRAEEQESPKHAGKPLPDPGDAPQGRSLELVVSTKHQERDDRPDPEDRDRGRVSRWKGRHHEGQQAEEDDELDRSGDHQ